MRIGFVGLGAMGRGLAGRLAKAGHEVRAWNRTPPPPDLPGAGVTVVPALSDLAASEVVVSMLAHDGAVREVFLEGGLLETLPAGAVHVNMATVSVVLARELADRHVARGLAYVAAPVLGRPDAAAEGRLHLLVAGPDAAVARLEGHGVQAPIFWRLVSDGLPDGGPIAPDRRDKGPSGPEVPSPEGAFPVPVRACPMNGARALDGPDPL